MPSLTASIPHQLSRVEVRRRIQDQIGKLQHQSSVIPLSDLQTTWTGDEMSFRVNSMGQAITGRLTVDDHAVHVELALPWLLGVLSGVVKQRIEEQGRKVLTNETPHSP